VILLVDAGNSAVKWSTLSPEGALTDGARALHRDASDPTALLHQAWSQLRGVKRVVGCAVAGPAVVVRSRALPAAH
jgi:pantothenate kinase type III